MQRERARERKRKRERERERERETEKEREREREREREYTHDDGSAAQECVFLRVQRASLRHTAAAIPLGGGGVCGGGLEVAGWLG